LESYHHVLDLYLWLSYRVDSFTGREHALRLKQRTEQRIQELLLSQTEASKQGDLSFPPVVLLIIGLLHYGLTRCRPPSSCRARPDLRTAGAGRKYSRGARHCGRRAKAASASELQDSCRFKRSLPTRASAVGSSTYHCPLGTTHHAEEEG